MATNINIGSGGIHYGTGNITVNNILGKSAEYLELLDRISGLQEDVNDAIEPEKKLRKTQKLYEAKSQLEQFKTEVIRLAETFAKVLINTDRLEIAKEHFQNGRLREADAILRVEDLQDEQAALLQRKQRLEEEQIALSNQLQQNASEWLIKAHLISLSYDLDGRYLLAKTYFENAMRSSRDFISVIEYATFLKDNNQFKDAFALLGELEELQKLEEKKTERNISMLRKIEMLTLKGFLELAHERFAEAEASYNWALKLTNKLKKAMPEYIKIHQLKLLSNLASISIEQEYFHSALGYSEEAIKLYRDIREPSVELTAEYGRASRCSGYGYLNSNEMASFIWAGANFRASLNTFRKLAEVEPVKYVSILVKCLTDMTLVSDKVEEIQDYYIEAIQLSRRESLLNPEVNLPILSQCLELYGGFLNNTLKKHNEAMKLAEEALNITEQLFVSNPTTYLHALAHRQENLAIMFEYFNQEHTAIEYYKKSFTNYSQLAKENPEKYRGNIARLEDYLELLRR